MPEGLTDRKALPLRTVVRFNAHKALKVCGQGQTKHSHRLGVSGKLRVFHHSFSHILCRIDFFDSLRLGVAKPVDLFGGKAPLGDFSTVCDLRQRRGFFYRIFVEST